MPSPTPINNRKIKLPYGPAHVYPNDLAKIRQFTPIYYDPISRRQMEGVASLIKLNNRQGEFEEWMVRFFGEKHTVNRLIWRGEHVRHLTRLINPPPSHPVKELLHDYAKQAAAYPTTPVRVVRPGEDRKGTE